MKNQSSPIAKEGIPFILLFSLVGDAFVWYGNNAALRGVGYFFFILTIFTIYFFRNPKRNIDGDARSVVAPADGRIIKAEEYDENDLLNAKAIKVSIFMNVFNVHINRVPVTGVAKKIKYHPGKFFNAEWDKASEHNERSMMLIETPSKALVLVVQIAGLIARRIVSYPTEGQKVEKGKRYGLIRFGSRLDVYLPPDSEITVKIGQKVKAGEVLGYLKHG